MVNPPGHLLLQQSHIEQEHPERAMPKSVQRTNVHLEHVSIDLRPVWWARLFSRKITLKLFVDHVVLPDGREVRSGFTANRGFSGANRLSWISDKGEDMWIAKTLCQSDVKRALALLESPKVAPRLKQLAEHSESLFNPNRFVSMSELKAKLEEANVDDQSLLNPDSPLHPTVKGYQILATRLLENGEETRVLHNKIFCEEALGKYQSFFDEVESNPLTGRQRDSIVGNEDANLVVAGAGSGKTSTIVARIAYLIREELANSDEILTIAFAKKAQVELEERAKDRIGEHGSTVSTFHALGLQIIGDATGQKPSVSSLATDSHNLSRFLTDAIESLAKNDESSAIQFLTEFSSAIVNPYDFQSLDEYYQNVKKGDLRTISGEYVASRQEVRIANWFFKNRIPYGYEEKYHKVKTGTETKRRYQPDFRLGENAYLEHFAVAPDQAEPDIFEGYKEEADWKRKLHAGNGTRLFETYSRDFDSNSWKIKLEQICKDLELEIDPMSSEELLEVLREQGRILQVTRFISQFLTLFKESESDLQRIKQALKSEPKGDVQRSEVFLDLFAHILAKYSDELKATETIDFSDMIVESRKHIESGQFKSHWKHIIIDEFQDISRGRASLVAALQQAQPHARVFAVGDDWQSIFRFAGSDVAVMARDFAEIFGHTRRTDLDQTFRYGTSLLNASSSFISQNPDQLQKSLSASGPNTSPGIKVIQFKLGEEYEKDSGPLDESAALQKALDEIIAKEGKEKTTSVILLGRYRRSSELLSAVRIPNFLDVNFMTCHASKGLEADYAIVCDLSKGRMGFPSEIEDDPLLDLVLKPDADFPFAEERRLFYVAITRARKQCILLTPASNSSNFVEELARDASIEDVQFDPEPASEPVSCPECNGQMIARDGKYGIFWSCHNYPLCTGKLPCCPECQAGTLLARGGGRASCSLSRCSFEGRACTSDACSGLMLPRSGKHGDFLGCSNYPNCRKTLPA